MSQVSRRKFCRPGGVATAAAATFAPILSARALATESPKFPSFTTRAFGSFVRAAVRDETKKDQTPIKQLTCYIHLTVLEWIGGIP